MAGEGKRSAAISGDDAMRAWAECRGLHRRYSAGVKRETSKICRGCAIEEANRACRRPFVKSRLRCNRGCESHGLSEAGRILRRTKCSRRRRQTRIDEHAHRARVPTTDVAATLVRHHVGHVVPVYIRHRHRKGIGPARAVTHRRLEGSIAVARQHAHRAVGTPASMTAYRTNSSFSPVIVEIVRRERRWTSASATPAPRGFE
jgi:hypothetical protein